MGRLENLVHMEYSRCSSSSWGWGWGWGWSRGLGLGLGFDIHERGTLKATRAC